MIEKLRDPFSGLSHLITAILAVFGLGGLLYLGQGSLARELSLLIYGISLVLMFSASAAYHLPKARPATLLVLRKFDHSAIYLLIAGTYTPICMVFFTGAWRAWILTIIWSMAIIGIGVKIFVINAPRWITAGIYLVMGWLAVAGIQQMIQNVPAPALAWILLGGLFYTGGAVIYILKKPNFTPGFGFHELWHIFVILGALSHYIAIAAYVAI